MRLPPLEVPDGDRVVLERTAHSRTAAQRDVTRAQIILMAEAGESNVAIAEAVGIDKHQVRCGVDATGLRALKASRTAPVPDDRLSTVTTTVCGS